MLKIIIAVLVVLLIVLLISSYKKVGPNQVLFITGAFLKGRVKVIKGGGAFVWPVLQQAQVQTLDTFNIDVNVEDIMTNTSVPVDVKATALLRVGSSVDMLATAAEKILGLDAQERDEQLTEIVKGGLREVLTTLALLEANNRATFQDAVINNITDTFSNLGLEITKLTITSISDKNDYYKSIYTKDVENKKADARIATAEADKRASLTEAQNEQEKQAAQLEAEKQIAANQRDTQVAKAKYQAEVNQQNGLRRRPLKSRPLNNKPSLNKRMPKSTSNNNKRRRSLRRMPMLNKCRLSLMLTPRRSKSMRKLMPIRLRSMPTLKLTSGVN